jgi:hypothetical protein
MRVREILTCLVGALVCAGVSSAGVITPVSPVGTVRADGDAYPISFELDEESGLWGFNFNQETAGYRIMFTGVVDPDPSIGYGLAVTDFGAPSSFGFTISSPIVSVTAPTDVIASIDGGLNDVTGNGISITPTLADADGDGFAEIQIARAGLPLENNGVDVGLAASFGAGPAGAQHVYGPYSTPIQTGPSNGPYTTLQLDVGFTLSGFGDIAAMTGFTAIEEQGGIVPEPSTLLLGVCALAALGAIRLRRRRRAV